MDTVIDPANVTTRGSLAGYPYMTANRVSYHLDLRGPSIPTTTACSASASALHLAVQAIRAGDCDAAVVGACQLNFGLEDWLQYSDAKVLSPDGKCKPFSQFADGFGRGEGVASIVLKPLECAQKDGDKIYGVVIGTGLSSTGSLAPVYAPVAEAQADAMRRAFHGTGRLPAEVDYVEAHATGTSAGDPTEANWIGENFKRPDGLVRVGSVKGNIGHLEAVSFFASISKACSIFSTGLIPPTVNVTQSTTNPKIRWDEYRLHVVTKTTHLKAPENHSKRALIAVAGSGIGGVNGHCLLEEPPKPSMNHSHYNGSSRLLIGGGLSLRSATAVCESLQERERSVDVAALARTYGRRSRSMTWKSYTLHHPEGGLSPFPPPVLSPRSPPPLVFVFSGQGSQHLHMGKQLFKDFPSFKQNILELDNVYRSTMGHSLVQRYGLFEDVQAETPLPDTWPITAILPSLAMIQIAVFNLLCQLGISPDVVVGHSAGEAVMFYASGSLTQEAALELAIARAIALSHVENSDEDAGMLALGCGAPVALEIIKEVVDSMAHGSRLVLELACENSPTAVTLSGHSELLDQVLEIASTRQFFARKLRTRVAVHSAIMERCREQYHARVSSVLSASVVSNPHVETYSTVTGNMRTDGPTAAYMWDNTRLPVHFVSAMSLIHQNHPNAVYIEISPHPALTSYIELMTERPVVCPLRRPGKIQSYRDDESYALLDCIGKLVVRGITTTDFSQLGPENLRDDSSVSSYPFSRRQIPLSKGSSMDVAIQERHGPLNYSHMKLSIEDHAQLAEHVIREEAILPATGYLEMAFERGARLLWDIRFDAALPILQQPTSFVHFQLEGTRWLVESVRSQDYSPPMTTGDRKNPTTRQHATGYMSRSSQACSFPLDIPAIKDRCKLLDIDIYGTMKHFAQFGPSYQRIEKVYMAKDEGLIVVRGADPSLGSQGYTVHPILLDACLHGAVNPIFTQNTDNNSYYLPSKLKMVRVHHSSIHLCDHLLSHIRLKEWKYNELVYDIDIVDAQGQRLVELQGLVVTRHEIILALPGRPHLDLSYQRFDLPTLPSSLDSVSPANATIQAQVLYAHIRTQPDTQTLVNAVALVADNILRLGQKQVVRIFSLGSSAILDVMGPILDSNPEVFLECYLDRAHHHRLAGKRNLTIRVAAAAETPSSPFDLVVVEDTSYSPSLISAMLVPGGKVLIKRVGRDVPDRFRTEIGTTSLCIQAVRSFSDSVLIEAQNSTLATFDGPSTNLNTPVITFELGQELDIRDQIHLYEASSIPIWVQASDDIHGGAARGFCHSLSRELSVNIRLAVFQGERSVDGRLQFINALSSLPGLTDEVEILVDPTGILYVPRLVPTAPAAPFSQGGEPEYWVKGDNEEIIEQLPPSLGSEGLILLRVSTISTHSVGGMVSIFGQVACSGATGEPEGMAVVTVCSSPTSNFALIHEGQICPRPGVDADGINSLLPLLVAVCGLGMKTFTNRNGRKPTIRISVIASRDSFALLLVSLLQSQGFSVSLLPPKEVLFEDIKLLESSHHIFCESIPTAWVQIVEGLSTRASIYQWGKDLSQSLMRDPGLIRETLPQILPLVTPFLPSLEPALHIQDVVAVSPSTRKFLLDPRKVYLLIGGIGSLGLHIALWMYENGARHIILTSRSGEATLANRRNHLALRILSYLKTLSGISIRLEACDATSLDDMQKLIDSVKPSSIGGCVMLTAVLSDRMYRMHDKESYQRAVEPKVGAFEVLRKCMDLDSLDFLVALSSSATFGCAGQANYSSGNTAVDWQLRQLRNAFTLVAPGVVDTITITNSERLESDPRLTYIISWALSARQICAALEDGLHKVKLSMPLWQVIPDLNWGAVSASYGPSSLYAHMNPSQPTDVDTSPIQSLTEEGLVTLVCENLELPREDLDLEVPLTSYGLDSLSAGRLSITLRPYGSLTQVQLLADLSTAGILQRLKESLISTKHSGASDGKGDPISVNDKIKLMQNLVTEYISDFPNRASRRGGKAQRVVLLTASTGHLGSYVLMSLVRDPTVAHIYTLNRPGNTSPESRQRHVLSGCGLDASHVFDSQKVTWLKGDLTQAYLGLEENTLAEMKSRVTDVVHLAWRVDFNLELPAFTSSLRGLRNLLDFAIESNARFMFASSVGVLANSPKGVVTGVENVGPEAAGRIGYSESKWVGEKIILAASESTGLECTVVRVGQLCGSHSSGTWNIKEWFPTMVQVSSVIKVLPDDTRRVSWLPVDVAAQAMVDMLHCRVDTSPSSPASIQALAHPCPIPWQTISTVLADELDAAIIPYAEWFKRVEGLLGTPNSKDLSAKALLPFFRGLHSSGDLEFERKDAFGFARMQVFPEALTDVLPLTEKEVRSWVKYWRGVRFLR
ncbi:Mycolipanoate synthase [Marasmius crinis-equi]|uniref:Mycolipanoate synthase n=1 Tax=Marasmius crinis-equi TaxID=585013 RepID=A0ABR3F1G9_9AGAR